MGRSNREATCGAQPQLGLDDPVSHAVRPPVCGMLGEKSAMARREDEAMKERIEIGDQTFLSDGGAEFGSVLEATPKELVVYVENAGEFRVSIDAVSAVHSKKVILDYQKLDKSLRRAIKHAHDAEEPGL
jgi:hypothetical protein